MGWAALKSVIAGLIRRRVAGSGESGRPGHDQRTVDDIARRLAAELEFEDLGRLTLALEHQWNQRLYARIDHYKQRPELPGSFARFIVEQIEPVGPVTVVDFGCHDCFLSSRLAELFEPTSKFLCIDWTRQETIYTSASITFFNTDIIDWLALHDGIPVDFVILGGTLTLLNAEQRLVILDWARRNARSLFVREVPRVRNLIEHYDDHTPFLNRSFALLDVVELKSMLKQSGFSVREIRQSFDIFVHATPDSSMITSILPKGEARG